MLVGAGFLVAGIFMIANEGVTFMSLAFILGVLFIIGGIIEAVSCNNYRGTEGDKSWVLIDGILTLTLGVLIIFNRLAADAAVPLVLGFWVLVSGVSNLVRAIEKSDARDAYFYGHLVTAVLNIVVGLYMYFNNDLFGMSVSVQVGICLLVQGINAFMIGSTILVFKSDFIKTKEEMLAQAVEDAEKAQEAVKEAIIAAKEAKAIVKEVEQTPEELLDPTVAPKPGELPEETITIEIVDEEE